MALACLFKICDFSIILIDNNTIVSSNKEVRLIEAGAIFFTLHQISYMLAHWLFCYKYWCVALRMGNLVESARNSQRLEDKEQGNKLIYWILVVLNILFPIV